MTRKRETGRVLRIRRLLEREVGGWWLKVHGGPFQQAGVPDLIGCTGGLFFAFEVKEPDGRIDPLQAETIRRIHAQGGGEAYVVIEPEETVAIVQRCLEAARRLPTGRRDIRRKGTNRRTPIRARDGEDVDHRRRIGTLDEPWRRALRSPRRSAD